MSSSSRSPGSRSSLSCPAHCSCTPSPHTFPGVLGCDVGMLLHKLSAPLSKQVFVGRVKALPNIAYRSWLVPSMFPWTGLWSLLTPDRMMIVILPSSAIQTSSCCRGCSHDQELQSARNYDKYYCSLGEGREEGAVQQQLHCPRLHPAGPNFMPRRWNRNYSRHLNVKIFDAICCARLRGRRGETWNMIRIRRGFLSSHLRVAAYQLFLKMSRTRARW